MKKRTLAIATAALLSLGLFSATGFTDPEGGWGYHHGPGMHQQGGPMYGGPMYGGPMQGDFEDWTEMRQQYHQEQLELLQGRLNLKSDQQQAWQAFSQAWKDHHGFMGRGWRQMSGGTQGQTNVIEHFKNRTRFMEEHLAEMKDLTQAAENLYAKLTPEQQQIMDTFFTTRSRFGWR